MADSIKIEADGVNRVLVLLNPEKAQRGMIRGLKKGALIVKGEISKYPPAANAHRPQPFVNDRSRRYFFWALRTGQIEVPYRRGRSPGSERHKASWTTEEREGGLAQVVGSDTTYGPLLQDKQRQTAYHKQTGWQTDADVVNATNDDVVDVVNREMFSAMTGEF